MRFEDEQYVRLYKRDTTTWLMLPWQARCILPLILKACDRAGIINLGEDGYEGLAVTIKVPIEIVEAAMPEILKRRILLLRADGLLVWPKFIEAQEAKQSDKARQKLARDRARDVALAAGLGVEITILPEPSMSNVVTTRDASITPRDEPSRPRPILAETVTLSCDQNSCDQNRQTESPAAPPAAVASSPVRSLQGSTPEPSPTPSLKPEAAPLLLQPGLPTSSTPERDVFEHWVTGWRRVVRGTRPPVLDEKRRGKIRARLADGYTVDDLKRAIDGMWATPWNVEGKHWDIELVCRDSGKVDRFMGLAPVKPLAGSDGPEAKPLYGPPAPPPEGLLERMSALGRKSVSPLLLEVTAAAAERGSEIRLATPTKAGGSP